MLDLMEGDFGKGELLWQDRQEWVNSSARLSRERWQEMPTQIPYNEKAVKDGAIRGGDRPARPSSWLDHLAMQ
jgi:hypothetical protein